jgi:3-oxoacyl-[acyl-carrier protein] reductase
MAQVLEGKVALVTGAGRGIGKVVAARLAQDGAAIVANYAASAAGAEELVREIEAAGGKAIAVQADITRLTEVKTMFAEVDRQFGRIDIVVNCAGVSGGGPLAELDEDAAEALLAINLKAPLYVGSEAAKRIGEGGRIINFSSSVAHFPIAGSGVYGAAKRAVEAMTESWAKELGRKGVTVNTVAPGATSPGMFDRTPDAWRDHFIKASPFSRVGTAGEVAEVVAFLASPASSWVSGTHIMANGAANV